MIEVDISHNNQGALELSNHIGDYWQAYENLPAEIRFCLQQANHDYCALAALQDFLDDLAETTDNMNYIIQDTIYEYIESDRQELKDFAAKQYANYLDYPHIAAGATFMSYNSRRKPRRLHKCSY